MRVLWRIVGYLKPYLGRMVAAALMLALSGILMAAVVATMKPLINEVLLQKPPEVLASDQGPDILRTVREWLPLDRMSAWTKQQTFVQVPVLIVLVFFVRSVFLYFGQYYTTKAGACVIRDLRNDLYSSVIFQSLRFFQENSSGLILSRILNDVQRLQKISTTALADLIRVGTMVPAIVLVILWYDWRMALFAAVALPVLALPMVKLSKKLRKASTRSQESMADLAGVVSESVNGAKVVQGFGMERFEIGRLGKALHRMLRADLKAGRAGALAPSLMELFGAIAAAVLIYLAGYFISQKSLDPGNFATVLTGLTLLQMSARRLNTINVDVQQALAAAERVFQMIDRECEIQDAEDARELPPFRERIAFEKVDFSYGDDTVLREIDLVLEKGEAVALVGASGSGKSTLANLIPRFFDPTSGRITIDGHDLREVTLRSLRSQIGLVTQETVLFDDTVRNNIAYGREEIPLERVREVAAAAYADGFIRELPDGYDTRLGEKGARLSMGQRQRLTIARALLKDPPILILDEATSALDSESEAEVQKALEVLMEGRTSIIIAHRLATVQRADRILVLDRGGIVEEGTHAELLRKGGAYARLHELQFRDPET
jgi:subfamily B ATP-binding cassette protein MsbA